MDLWTLWRKVLSLPGIDSRTPSLYLLPIREHGIYNGFRWATDELLCMMYRSVVVTAA
jgi:hypothetical protein